MKLKVIVAAGASVVALCALPGSASAGDPGCIWGRLPEPAKQAFYARYREQGPAAMNRDALPTDQIAVAALACGVAPEQSRMRAAGAAVGGLALAEASAIVLRADHGIERARLDDAWTRLAAADRTTLVGLAQGLERGAASRTAAQQPVIRYVGLVAAGGPGTPPNPQAFARHAAAYALARAVVEAHSDDF